MKDLIKMDLVLMYGAHGILGGVGSKLDGLVEVDNVEKPVDGEEEDGKVPGLLGLGVDGEKHSALVLPVEVVLEGE